MSRRKDKSRKKESPVAPLTRRDFLKGAGVAVSGTILAGHAAVAAAAPETAVVGPGATSVTLRVNGQRRELNLEPRVTLLDALRNDLDVTGAKRVCDRGVCGTCTVLMDGKPVYACSVLAIEAQGHEITTIEGLMHDGQPHPVMTAFVNNDAQQCGFCTPGFVVACAAFLHKHPNPTEAEVEKGLGGNLCRCGTYVGVRAAALEAAKTMMKS
ncbi:MAG: (2Fe-2S)-binding protein [Terriglobia bacterium]